MVMSRTLAKWPVILVASAALVSAGIGIGNGLFRAAHVWKGALDHGLEPLSFAQERLFGAAYMAAVRNIQARVAETETLYVIDDQSHDAGACYFALNHLAPRRMVRLGTTREQGIEQLVPGLPPSARWVLFVPDLGEAPELVPAAVIRKPRERAR